jgi:hypothetical protein
MTRLSPGRGRSYPGTELKFPGFDASWAGEGPSPDLLCLGSEDGRLLLTTTLGVAVRPPFHVVDSGEAINGAAFWGCNLAASTRNEVAVIKETRTSEEQGIRSVFPVGAHGVIATSTGVFIAPGGRTGLLVIKPERGDFQHVGVVKPEATDFYFYRVSRISMAGRPDILALAGRGGGVGGMEIPEPEAKSNLSSFTLEALDIVDVCALGSAMSTPAVCAVDRNCTLGFFRDVLHDSQPVAMKFDDIPGTAYRLLSAKGHLILLTSCGVYILTGLGKRFLEGEDVQSQRMLVQEFPNHDVIDANLSEDRWLLIILPDRILAFDLDVITEPAAAGEGPNGARKVIPRLMQQTWKTRASETTLTEV